ncbi:MAG: F-type H+-transporting ATPase subunit b, partial [Pseudonocardiales bacterium]|nr:F-type H+-transporting ATPase subunit b [Pseudonocardiales bacterium]
MYDRTMTKYLAADNFLLPNGTFFAELVAFLLMLFVFWKFVVPPLSESLRERQEMVRKLVENSEEA